MSTEREPYIPPAEPMAVSAVQRAELIIGAVGGTDLGLYSSIPL